MGVLRRQRAGPPEELDRFRRAPFRMVRLGREVQDRRVLDTFGKRLERHLRRGIDATAAQGGVDLFEPLLPPRCWDMLHRAEALPFGGGGVNCRLDLAPTLSPIVAVPPQPTFFATEADFRRWLDANHETAPELLVGSWTKGRGR